MLSWEASGDPGWILQTFTNRPRIYRQFSVAPILEALQLTTASTLLERDLRLGCSEKRLSQA